MIFGWLGWSLRSTTCSSASSAYRPSSVVASRSSMPRRSASASNDWLVLVISLVLIWCLLIGAGLELRARRSPGTGNGPSKPRPERIGPLRNCRDLGIPTTMTAAMLEIRVIGELEVQLAGTKAELPASARPSVVSGWLAVHPGRHPPARQGGELSG